MDDLRTKIEPLIREIEREYMACEEFGQIYQNQKVKKDGLRRDRKRIEEIERQKERDYQIRLKRQNGEPQKVLDRNACNNIVTQPSIRGTVFGSIGRKIVSLLGRD